MTGSPTPPEFVTRIGDDFFWPFNVDWPTDRTYLEIGQTEWYGPVPQSGPYSKFLSYAMFDAQAASKNGVAKGLYLHVQRVGAYVRTRRLREGPLKKLADWKSLPVGGVMLIDPVHSVASIDAAETRIRYMRYKGLGRFRCWSDVGGALWVAREGPASAAAPNSSRIVPIQSRVVASIDE